MTPVQATEILKVMTFNLRTSNANDGANNWTNNNQEPERRDVARNAIITRLPDVAGLQEGRDDQLDFLQAELPDQYQWDRQRPSGGNGGDENAAFAYNTNTVELIERGVLSLGTKPGGGYWNNIPGTPFDPYSLFPEVFYQFPRLALWGKFRWRATGQEFVFYTTHFDVFNPTYDGEAQVKSAELILRDARARTNLRPASPLAIVGGDFNGSQNDRAWRLLTGSYSYNGVTGDFLDSWWQTHSSWNDAGTFHGFNGGTVSGNSRIDWILHRGGFSTMQCEIVTDSALATVFSPPGTRTQYPSDHYPVFATLQFPALPADHDRDGLPDTLELASPLSLPADADTEDDGLIDGEEDLDGSGTVEPGETDPHQATSVQNPTDVRNFQMDGVLDYASGLLASHGLDLYWKFDGRYLYVATQDAGEGNDHFVLVTRTPGAAAPAPWAKSGSVAQFDAFLADENNNAFASWFNAARTQIADLNLARAAAYYTNGGWLEGVIDLSQLYGAGFTNRFYLAAGPYQSGDGGALYAPSQVPAGNGDGNILGSAEYVEIVPGDTDQDGINDFADVDRDGDGLPDAWELAWFGNLTGNADDDADGDGADSRHELLACTSPLDAASVFRATGIVRSGADIALSWPAIHGKTYTGWSAATNSFGTNLVWSCVFTNAGNATFPSATNTVVVSPAASPAVFFRLRIEP
jgi:endonuclease/exonuclease/phosphatase family metal-dependent hydrolase